MRTRPKRAAGCADEVARVQAHDSPGRVAGLAAGARPPAAGRRAGWRSRPPAPMAPYRARRSWRQGRCAGLGRGCAERSRPRFPSCWVSARAGCRSRARRSSLRPSRRRCNQARRHRSMRKTSRPSLGAGGPETEPAQGLQRRASPSLRFGRSAAWPRPARCWASTTLRSSSPVALAPRGSQAACQRNLRHLKKRLRQTRLSPPPRLRAR